MNNEDTSMKTLLAPRGSSDSKGTGSKQIPPPLFYLSVFVLITFLGVWASGVLDDTSPLTEQEKQEKVDDWYAERIYAFTYDGHEYLRIRVSSSLNGFTHSGSCPAVHN